MKKIILGGFLISVLLFPQLVLAQEAGNCFGIVQSTGNAWLDGIINRICGIAAGVAMAAVVIFILIAGYYFVSAKGDEEKIRTARTFLLWALVGAAVIIGVGVLIGFARWIAGV